MHRRQKGERWVMISAADLRFVGAPNRCGSQNEKKAEFAERFTGGIRRRGLRILSRENQNLSGSGSRLQCETIRQCAMRERILISPTTWNINTVQTSHRCCR